MTEDEARIEALEARVADLESQVESLLAAAPSTSSLAPPPGPPPLHHAASQPPPPAPDARPVSLAPGSSAAPAPAQRSIDVDSETLLKWGGVGLVVMAVAFAVSTAIQRGWIGPLLQLIGAVAIAVALIVIGLGLRTDRRPWAHALCSGGVAALFVTFASSLFLDEANTDIAYVLTLVVGFGALALARVVPSEWVGVVALGGAVIGWLVIADGSAPFIESGAALVVGVVAVIVVAVEREWVGLRVVTALVGLVAVLAFGAVAEGGNEQVATLAAGAIVALVLLVVPSIGDPAGLWRGFELRIPTLLAPWAWIVLVILFFDSDRAPGWVALVVATAVSAIAVAAASRLLAPHLIALLVGASVCVTAGAGILLNTETAWLAIAVQGVGLLVLARTLPDDWLMQVNAAVLLFVAAVFAAVDGVDAWSIDTDVGADLARLGVIVAVAAGVWLSGVDDLRRIGGLAVLGLVMVWLGSVLVHLPEGQAAVSLSWAVVGVVVIVAGAVRKIPDLATVGLAVLALTVAKLLVVDMAEVDTLWRAGLFLLVGLALLRLGFLLPRLTRGDDATPAPSS